MSRRSRQVELRREKVGSVYDEGVSVGAWTGCAMASSEGGVGAAIDVLGERGGVGGRELRARCGTVVVRLCARSRAVCALCGKLVLAVNTLEIAAVG